MNYNRVIIGGNLTRDPELRYSQSGTAICKFGVAINETYTSNGEKRQNTHFVDVTVFGRTGEVINEHLRKGDPFFGEGKLDFSSWEDRSTGQKRNKLAVIVERFQFVGSKRDSSPAGSKPSTDEADYGDIPF